MGWKSILIKPFATWIHRSIDSWSTNAVKHQEKWMKYLVNTAANTQFGKDHHFQNIVNYDEFKSHIPIKDYEDLKGYIEKAKNGESDVLWIGKPAYFAKTSGTTSGVKYIPISKESIPNHFGTARNALFNYYKQSGNGAWLDGKVIFLSGSPELETIHGIPTGRLSGISNHMVPAWLKKSQLPTYETNCIEDWEEKVDKIVVETVGQDLRLISGIPPWVQMYFERLLAYTGKEKVIDVFPNFSVFVFGGVNYEPYRTKMEALIGKKIDSVETYPASEGFIAFQDSQKDNALLLNTDSGIFFEFIPADEIFNENPTRIWLKDVKLKVNYVLIINNNAGLWGYNIGDTIEFVSVNPYKIKVTGRVKHFISAFGEHVIGKEVEDAMLIVSKKHEVEIIEFTVAPNITPEDGSTPYHEWFIEFAFKPNDLAQFAKDLDAEMCARNIYYADLIVGKILQPLIIRTAQKDAFREYMKSQGKLGGQNKVPRLSNDRKIVESISIES
jgi:GH3 auxin-responsive promoter